MNKKGMYIIMEENQQKQKRVFEIHVSKAKQFAEYCEANGIVYETQYHDSYWKFSCLMSDGDLAKAKVYCDRLFRKRKTQPQGEAKPDCIIIEVTRFIFMQMPCYFYVYKLGETNVNK